MVLKKFIGKKFMDIIRSTFLIDTKSIIIKIWTDVKIKDHSQEILCTLKNFQDIKKVA